MCLLIPSIQCSHFQSQLLCYKSHQWLNTNPKHMFSFCLSESNGWLCSWQLECFPDISVTLPPELASSCPLLLDGDAPYGVEHFKNHFGRSSPNHQLPHLCRWHTWWGVSQKGATVALRWGIVSLTRISSISCISSPIFIGGHTSTNWPVSLLSLHPSEVYCNTRFTPLCVWHV